MQMAAYIVYWTQMVYRERDVDSCAERRPKMINDYRRPREATATGEREGATGAFGPAGTAVYGRFC
jgi:hypothetical protein